MIPLFIVLGTMGWVEFTERSKFWASHQRLSAVSWGFFWVVNTILLIAFTFTYSKRARVEAMSYLSRYDNIQTFAILDEENCPELMPYFYLNQWPTCYNKLSIDPNTDSLLNVTPKILKKPPRFILFTGDKKIQPMVIKARQHFPYLVYETTIEPGFMDRFIHWLNPINKNRRIFIYRNTAVVPKKHI